MTTSDTDQAKQYANNLTITDGELFNELISRVKISPGLKCLDIGCASGNNTLRLAKLVGDTGHVTGIDPDNQRIKVAKEKFMRPNIEYLCGKSVQLPSCECGYDLVVSNLVMHWMNYEERLQTYRRVFEELQGGGECAILEVANLPEIYYQILSFCDDDIRNYFNNIFNFLTVEQNMEIFQRLGFEIIQIKKEVNKISHPSINDFLDLFSAVSHGKIDANQIYINNSDKINIEVADDGSITPSSEYIIIIAKKPT